MSRRSAIRWKQSDEAELKKAVRNFNDKIRRLEKKYPNKKTALPERVTLKEIKANIQTRNDFKREINVLKRFSKRGAEEFVMVPGSEYNLKTTKWQMNEMLIKQRVINRKRAERYKYISEIQATSRGEDLGYTVGDIGMKSIDENAVTPMNAFYPTMARKDLNMRFKSMRIETQEHFWDEKELRLKENVMKGIEAHYHGLFPDDTDEILKAIEEMSFKEFYKKFVGESGEMEIVSPPPGATMKDALEINMEALKSTWIPNYETSKPNEVTKLKQTVKEHEDMKKATREAKKKAKQKAIKEAKKLSKKR